MSDPARQISFLIDEAMNYLQIGKSVGVGDGELIERVAMYGMACVQVTLEDRRTFFVDVTEGPLS